MPAITVNTTKIIEPKCYAYTTPEIARHNGWTKIGYTEQNSVETRIKQQSSTIDTIANLEWCEKARYTDGTPFKDKDFHRYLKKLGIERKSDTEWFFIEPDKSYIEFDKFRKNKGILQATDTIEYKLRKEQNDAVEITKNYFLDNAEDEPEFLWNAKPRFGKTISAYDLCKRLNAKQILIVTNRPAVANSWYSDYVKFLGAKSGYHFISDTDSLKGTKYTLTRNEYLNLRNKTSKFIEFVSLQDLKGSLYFGGQFEKLKHIANLNWDVLIIDEAHEAVDTYKTDVAFDRIKRKYTLHLSGTPFKAIAKDKFYEEQIYNWTYADEQKAKRDWDKTSEEENPYETLPQLNLFTYQMSEIIRDTVKQGADFNDDGDNESYAFDLNEFFTTNSKGEFKYNDDVDKFLNALTTQEKFPFSTEELRENLKHTFWLLNRVDSAKALVKKLKEHKVFKDYQIILAAGDGKLNEHDENKKSYNKVVESIEKYDKTITISVGQLTTGITIPEWTAVLMLSNLKSPALYMQAAFRAQNPCLFKEKGQLLRKENAYVFDFDPARTLEIFEMFANDLYSDTSKGKGGSDERKNNVRELINFFPVYAEDENGRMIELDAEKVLSIPRKIHALEVVRRGFMSNFLFQNISNIFSAPLEVVEIIKQFEAVKEPINIKPDIKEKLSINDNGEVEIEHQKIIGLEKEVFGEKIYKLQDEFNDVIERLTKTDNKKIDNNLEELKKQFVENLSKPLIDTAKNHYSKDLSQSTQKIIEKKIKEDIDNEISRTYGSYKIEVNKIEAEREEELKNNYQHSDTINKKYNQMIEGEKNKLTETLKNKTADMVEHTAATIIETTEKEIKNKEKSSIENTIRDHLRGFSRTIPSFLMAYGDSNTTLENFDAIIPDNVFKDVTGISVSEFRFLRDGGTYTDHETGETKIFKGNLFDEVVFNDSVKEFLSLKKKLSNYFDEGSTEDIFDYIPNQKTNQIFTPKNIVIKMVDELQKENPDIFENEKETFIDLYVKSGLYITEIVKRLFKSNRLKQLFPDENDRLRHIFANQVYGLAPTEIIYRIALSFILGFTDKKEIKHNLKQYDTLISVQNGTLEKDLDKLFLR